MPRDCWQCCGLQNYGIDLFVFCFVCPSVCSLRFRCVSGLLQACTNPHPLHSIAIDCSGRRCDSYSGSSDQLHRGEERTGLCCCSFLYFLE